MMSMMIHTLIQLLYNITVTKLNGYIQGYHSNVLSLLKYLILFIVYVQQTLGPGKMPKRMLTN